MKIGIRKPSIKKRFVARTSGRRALRHRIGLKVPGGWGWVTNPRKAAYNRVYRRATRGCIPVLLMLGSLLFSLALIVAGYFR